VDTLLDYLPVILAGLSSLILFLNQKWRWNILAIAVIYVSVFWMVLQVWSPGLAVVKLIAGWMAGAILGSAMKEDTVSLAEENKVEQRFKLVIVMIMWIFSFSIMQRLSTKLPIPEALIWGGVLLIIMGILQISMSLQPIRIIFGLLVAFSGFEVLYAGVEQSLLVAGFLVIITLGIALIGVLFIQQEEGEIV
jgi:hypothetical protein